MGGASRWTANATAELGALILDFEIERSMVGGFESVVPSLRRPDLLRGRGASSATSFFDDALAAWEERRATADAPCELHLSLVWHAAAAHFDAVVDDVTSAGFRVIALERTVDAWSASAAQFRAGLRRLYARNERFGDWLDGKVVRVGEGPFGALVYCDPTPHFERRRTSDGDAIVNGRAWDAKQRCVARGMQV